MNGRPELGIRNYHTIPRQRPWVPNPLRIIWSRGGGCLLRKVDTYRVTKPLQWVLSHARALYTIAIHYLHAISNSICCRGRAALVITQFFCWHKPASTFFAQLVGMFDSPSLIMHKNLPRKRLSGLSLNLACIVFCCLHAGCSYKAGKIRKTCAGRLSQRKTGGRLAQMEKNGGGNLPGTGALTLIRPKTGGWALTWEWVLTQDNTVYVHKGRIQKIRKGGLSMYMSDCKAAGVIMCSTCEASYEPCQPRTSLVGSFPDLRWSRSQTT